MKPCGIYCWHTPDNDKRYIGQSRDIKYRRTRHLSKLRAGTHCNQHLQRAFRCYGEAGLVFSILQECSVDELDSAEVEWIKRYNSTDRNFGYNFSGGGRTGKTTHPETRRKLSELNTGKSLTKETREKLSTALSGRVRPPEEIAKLRDTCRNRTPERRAELRYNASLAHMGHPTSEETRKKIADSLRGRPSANRGRPSPMRGKKQSPEHIRKRRVSRMENAKRKGITYGITESKSVQVGPTVQLPPVCTGG